MRRRFRGKRKWIALVGAVVVAGAAVGVWALARPDESSATPTITATATVGTIRQTVAATGTLAPAQRADLTFQVAGTVTTVPVAVGDKVAKGATVATLDGTDLQTAVDAARAGVSAAQDQVDAASGSSSAQVASAQAQLAAAQSSLARAKASLADATLTTPIAGTVAAVSIATGDAVGSGGSGNGSNASSNASSGDSSSAQVVVIATNAWVVNASVGASDLASVKKGLQVDITPDGSAERVFGTVSSVGIMASTGSSGAATFPVVIKVTGSPTGLYAGGTVNVAIVVKQVDNVLTVPSAALTSEGDTTYVTLSKNGKQTRTKVVIGTVYGASTQITAGVSEGDQVVLRQVRLPQGGTGGTGGNQRQRGGEVPDGFPGGGQLPEGQFPGGAPNGGQAPAGPSR